VSWWRRVLAQLPLVRVGATPATPTVPTNPKHRAILRRADRVIEAYRQLDVALALHVKRKS